MIDTVRSRMEKIVASIVRTISETFMKSDVISDAWVSGKTYAVGEYAISDGTLWKCKVANSVKPSEGANWTAVKVVDALKIKTRTVTGKTGTAGQLDLGFNTDYGIIVAVSVTVPSSVYADIYTYSGRWYAFIRNYSASGQASVDVTATVYYI